MKSQLLLLLVISVLISKVSFAQTQPADSTKQKVIIVTFDGKERIGEILNDDGREILLLTASLGKIYISKENIKEIRKVDLDEIEKYDGDYRSTGPFTTRYAFTTNALPIKKNEDYAMLNLYGPEVHFSVADNFSVGVMSSWIASPFILALKYTIPTSNDKVNIGFGSLIGTSGYLNTFRGYGGLAWGMITFGDRMSNLSISGGYSYTNTGFRNTLADPGFYPATIDAFGNYRYPMVPYQEVVNNPIMAPVFSIGGITKVGKKASFVFDSMIFFSTQEVEGREQEEILNTNNDLIAINIKDDPKTLKVQLFYLMPGMRFQSRDNRAFQISLAGITAINNTDNETIAFPVPMLSWFSTF